MSDLQQEKPSGQSWLMLITVYLISVSVAIIWFSVPPMLSGGTLLNAYFPNAQGAAIGHAMGQLGNTMSFVSMGALAAAVISAFLAKRIGIKNSIIIGGALVAIAGFGSALSGGSISALLALRVLMGIGVGFVAVNSVTAITMWFSAKNRAFTISIWGTWVTVGMLVTTNAIVNPMSKGDLAHANPHSVWIVESIIVVVCLLLVIFAYKNPPQGQTEISTEAKPFKEVLPLFKQHQIWMVLISWCAFNYINYSLSTYNAVFFAGGFGPEMFTGTSANMWASIVNSMGILAPLFGVISDRINRNRKYLMVILGVLFLTMSGVVGFKVEFLGLSGWPLFWIYLMVQFLGNAILVATVRPYIPLLVGRGGVTAISLGLSLITVLQYTGHMFTPLFVKLVQANGGILARSAGQPIGDLAGWATATWIGLVIPGIVALICCFFIKPAAHPHGEHGGPHATGHAGPHDHH
jgi:MFS family permease